MSYPSRPPMGMPPVQGHLIPPPFGYAPMGMMPIGLGLVPMMQPATMSVAQQVSVSQQSIHMQATTRPPLKSSAEMQSADKKEEKPPVTTVFVGNISERAPDTMIRQMLQRCGNVLSWKRVQGASGKLQAFGFCEFEDPEATLRCMRLLNDWLIGDKKLVVKVDAKTKNLLDEHKRKKKEEKGEKAVEKAAEKEEQEEGEEKGSDSEDNELDEFTQREDRVAKAGLDAIMREYSNEVNREIPGAPPADDNDKKEKKVKKDERQARPDGSLDHLEIEETKKDLIHREIRSFRESHNKETDEDRPADQDRDRDNSRRRRLDEEREREQRERERQKERDRERERERDRERERERDRDRERRDKERLMSERTNRSRTRERSSQPERSHEHDVNAEDEEDAYERKKLERRLREKEAAYQELLRKWESRERKKTRDYEKEREREKERKTDESKEARRLKEFFEDYDDERDDVKFYKGSALQRRLNEREKEMEADERDRLKEREELDEIRKKLLEEGHPDPDSEMERIEREREEHLLPRLAPSPDHDLPDASYVRVRSSSPESVSSDTEMIVDNNVSSVPPKTFVPVLAPPVHHSPPVERYRSVSPPPARNSPVIQRQVSPPPRSSPPPERRNPPASERRIPQPVSPPARRQPLHAVNSPVAIPPPVVAAPVVVPVPVAPVVQLSHSILSDDSLSGLSQQFGSAPSSVAVGDKTSFAGVFKSGASDSPNDQQQKRKKMTVDDVFNNDDEEVTHTKKRKLIPLDYTDEERAAVASRLAPLAAATTAEEKRKSIKNLIERIPTAKDDLFAFPVDWTMVDMTLMDRRIKPWVNKKIVEYIGEDEPTLSDFICKKVIAHSSPSSILADISMVLDDEAEVFVVKMWRLLIYETEAKKLGLVK